MQPGAIGRTLGERSRPPRQLGSRRVTMPAPVGCSSALARAGDSVKRSVGLVLTRLALAGVVVPGPLVLVLIVGFGVSVVAVVGFGLSVVAVVGFGLSVVAVVVAGPLIFALVVGLRGLCLVWLRGLGLVGLGGFGLGRVVLELRRLVVAAWQIDDRHGVRHAVLHGPRQRAGDGEPAERRHYDDEPCDDHRRPRSELREPHW